jgi:hypothetical protein
LTLLEEHIADLEEAMTKQSSGVGTRISANAAIDETISFETLGHRPEQ